MRIGKFIKDRRGSTAVTVALSFAVLAPMTIGLFGVYQATEQHGKLQDALDAATLYAARSTAQTDTDIDAIGDKALVANLSLIPGAVLKSSTFYLSGSKVEASASVQLASVDSGLFAQRPVGVKSEVNRAGKIEVALVLDNTGSMASNSKLTNLQTAAKSLIDKLVTASTRSADPNPLKIALVPFSSTVRVQGTTALGSYTSPTSRGALIPTWIDPLGQSHRTSGSTYDIFDVQTDRFALLKAMNNQSWSGCVESRPAPYDIQETAPDSSTPATLFVPYFWPDELGTKSADSNGYYNSYLADTSASGTMAKLKDHTKYTGAIRTGTNSTTGYTYGPNAGCTLQPMIRLTSNTASVKTAIGAMVATGETNIPQGLVWGWHTLSPNAPLADGAAYGTQNLRKIIVLMTDGQNTFTNTSNSYGSLYHGFGMAFQGMLSGIGVSSSAAERTAAMDARLAQLCTNIKAKNVVIYTVLVDSTPTNSLLQTCASSPDKFFNVTSSGLNTAFNTIADSIQNLRISQ
jgi:Flp pilus assembly protein TadG